MRNAPLTLWAESPEEARLFLARASRNWFPYVFERILVAKRSPKNRSNQYVGGEYFATCNSHQVTVFERIEVAPPSIRALVQWCTCDVMISRGDEPVAVVEDTTHIVRMNVYQRIPRLYKAAMLGVPAVALQGTRGLNFNMRGDCWGMHRYMRAFAAIARAFPHSPVLPIYYIPDHPQITESSAENLLFSYLNALLSKAAATAQNLANNVLAHVNDIDQYGFPDVQAGVRHIAPDLPSIQVGPNRVTVRIGAKPEKDSWANKGSGQMDPYIGMIAAAKYIYCFNGAGQQIKEMVVEFTYLPPHFWWFRDWQNSTSLYKTLAFEIADRVEFLG